MNALPLVGDCRSIPLPDESVDAVGADKRESDAMWTLRAAYSAVEKARSAIQADRQASDRWAERQDPELRWKEQRIEEAERGSLDTDAWPNYREDVAP